MPGRYSLLRLASWISLRELRAARPHGHVRAAVGEDLAERRSPAARADDGDARARGILPTAQGDPSPSGRDRPGSSARRGAGSPRSCESSPAMSAITTSVASTSAAAEDAPADVGRQVDRVADDDAHAAAQRPELELAVARQHLPGQPQWAIGMSGMSPASASRTAPVLPRIGHSSGSRVSVPSG